MGKYKCSFCGRKMIATALSYQSNQYCNHCFNERADSTQKKNLNTFEFMGEKSLLPKEKAAELVNKFKNIDKRIYDINPEYFDLFLLTQNEAKECSFILVDEIINLMYDAGNRPEFTKKYWQEVKQEIEKI